MQLNVHIYIDFALYKFIVIIITRFTEFHYAKQRNIQFHGHDLVVYLEFC